jgi:predicted P-loop ATPase
MVARVKKPGCKVDHMIIFEGEQGIGKTTALNALVGDEWFLSTMLDLASKEIYSMLDGIWLCEFGELATLSKGEVGRIKGFLTERFNAFVPKYQSVRLTIPRQCVFSGTVNEKHYLSDETGARRMWPVECNGAAKVGLLRAHRDQIWAEALAVYNGFTQCHADHLIQTDLLGDPETGLCKSEDERCELHRWWPAGAEAAKLFEPEQAERSMYDSWFDSIKKFLDESVAGHVTVVPARAPEEDQQVAWRC